jgi:hypothetical protein
MNSAAVGITTYISSGRSGCKGGDTYQLFSFKKKKKREGQRSVGSPSFEIVVQYTKKKKKTAEWLASTM